MSNLANLTVEDLETEQLIIKTIEFKYRDHENLINDYMDRCGYSRKEAELSASHVLNQC